MIMHTSELLVCPHCRGSGELAPVAGTRLTRCTQCRFVYPQAPAERNDSEILELDDETWTEKWGAIRADRYHVERVLASGAQGRILLARHRHLDQQCVIKLVSTDDVTWSDVANKRLRNEAQAGVRVNHPNVARVIDCDCVDRAWYFVMEYIRGENLRRIIRQVPHLPPAQVVEIGLQAASGLVAIHRGGLIHRDLKPSNIMLSADGTVKIMDLGLVKLLNSAEEMGVTHAGQVVGTPLYMPPEQFDATEQVEVRSDIYAMGATLYHLLTGHPPFDGANFKEIAHRHRHEPVRWSDDDRERVPQWLRDVVESCLAKRREHRIASAALLELALREHESTSRHAAIEYTAAPEGVSVMTFKNLSRHSADEWIGDAIAEYIAGRMMEFDGLHVADRNVLARIIRQTADESADEPSREQIIEAARLVGVGHVIVGSFQCQADQIRITAQRISHGEIQTKHLSTTSGPVAELFDLEDRLTDQIISALEPILPTGGRRSGLSGATNNPKAHEQYVRGQRAFVDGDYHAAKARAEEAATLDPDYDDPISLIGSCYARLGDYDRAVEYHHRQERRASESGDPASLASALGNLGAMYYYKGDYAVAHDFLRRAAALSDAENQTPDTAKLYGNLGMVLTRLEETDEASDAFERAIKICKDFNDIVSMVWPYNGMGSLLLKQKRYTEAREYHQRALTLAQEIGDRVMVGVAQMNIGRCACLLRDFEEAGIWFNAALGSLERTKFWNGLTLVYEHLAEMHLLEDKPQDALGCIDKRIELASRHGNKRMESQAWEQKARAYEKMQSTEEALTALKTSLAVSQRPEPHESLHRYLEDVGTRRPLR